MGNHEYWDTPEYRAEEIIREAVEARQKAKYNRLIHLPSDIFTVDEVNTLRQFYPGGVMEHEYDVMWERTLWRRVDRAKNACYWRLHPQPWTDTSKGARILYDAVCRLWNEVIPR